MWRFKHHFVIHRNASQELYWQVADEDIVVVCLSEGE
jgi:hypothetical protein